jgi:hypothetical protein
MYNYHLAILMPRCALKIVIKKAFDMVSLEYILTVLMAIGASNIMVRWIEICMSTTNFLVAMNEESHEFSPSFRGLQQCEPLSLFLP